MAAFFGSYLYRDLGEVVTLTLPLVVRVMAVNFGWIPDTIHVIGAGFQSGVSSPIG